QVSAHIRGFSLGEIRFRALSMSRIAVWMSIPVSRFRRNWARMYRKRNQSFSDRPAVILTPRRARSIDRFLSFFTVGELSCSRSLLIVNMMSLQGGLCLL